MAYTKTNWKDRVVQNPRTYNTVNNADGTITLVPVPGTVTEAGTPVSASNLNKVEQALYLLNNIFNASGLTGTYTLTIEGITSLSDIQGVPIKVKMPNANNGGTLNVNSYGAKQLYKPGSIKFTHKANGVYTWVYDGTNFIVQGEGGEIPKLPNLIKNGSFENGDNCWLFTNFAAVNIITADYKMGSKCIDLNAAANVSEAFVRQSVFYNQGHKYYICGWIRSSNVFTIDCYFPEINPYPLATTSCQGSNVWQFFSGIFPVTSAIASGLVPLRLDINNNNVSVWARLDCVMLFDLTEAFGTDTPPQTEIDNMVQRYSGWWDSDLPQLTADATFWAEHLLTGKVAYGNGLRVDGTMPEAPSYPDNNTATMIHVYNGKPNSRHSVFMLPPRGYYDGVGDWVGRDVPGLIPQNIVAGVVIGDDAVNHIVGTNTNKKWASGSFNYEAPAYGAVINQNVSGLPFTPKTVMAMNYLTRTSSGGTGWDGSSLRSTEVFGSYSGGMTGYSGNRIPSITSIVANGFTVQLVDPNGTYRIAGTVYWIAIA